MPQNRTKKTSRKTKKRRTERAGAANAKLRAPSPLRGLLPTPPEIAELVAREVDRLPMTTEARQRITHDWTLQYYFGGHEVAYRKTPKGVQVLAAGLEEIGQLLRRLPYSQQKGIVFGHPEPWC